MNDDRYDDGLVHGHSWATEPPTHTAPNPPRGPDLATTNPDKAEAFDDGLVHAHGWASADCNRGPR
jgi:hypothetical protein